MTEGIRINSEEIVKVLKAQYDLLFNKAIKVNKTFFDEILLAMESESDQ